MTAKRLLIYTDGASLGNPGRAAIGVVIHDGQDRVVSRLSRSIGYATNNQAEYWAIIAALEETARLGAGAVDIKSDSELVVEQLNGRYRVKKASLRPLYQKVVQLIGSLESFTITHIPREQNREADNLAHLALS
jgi:ribonuclease HI